MGIAVKELLTLEYFKDYHVIAGNQAYTKRFREQPSLKHPMPCAGQKERAGPFLRICISSGTRLPRRSI